MFKLPLFPVILCIVVQAAMGQDGQPKENPQEASIKAMLKSYVEHFNKEDLKGVAGFWAEDCSYLDRNTGERAEGRDAIREDLKAVFAEEQARQLSATVQRVKLVTDRVAQVEGTSVITTPNADPQVSNFSLLLVQNDKQWQIHSLEESAVLPPESSTEALQVLDWMIGKWVDETESARIETSVRWTANQAFLLRSYAVQTAEGIAQEGTQVIGWDPRAKQIRSWAFNSDGSFGEGTWSKNGDDWLIKSAQTLADGRAASGTYVVTRANPHQIQMRLIGHTIDGEPQPASGAVTMKRVEAESPSDTESSSEAPAKDSGDTADNPAEK